MGTFVLISLSNIIPDHMDRHTGRKINLNKDTSKIQVKHAQRRRYLLLQYTTTVHGALPLAIFNPYIVER